MPAETVLEKCSVYVSFCSLLVVEERGCMGVHALLIQGDIAFAGMDCTDIQG